MANTNYDIDELIAKVLAGEADAGEQVIVESWRLESADNERSFQRTKTIFEKAAAVNVRVSFDADAAWQNVRKRIKPQPAGRQVSFRTNFWIATRVAAGILLVAAAGVWIFDLTQNTVTPSLEVVTVNKTAQDTLPDGSTAFLNKKSSITYAFDKKTNTRKVALKGEGYFEVKHEEKRPFVIEADEALVKDLGTAFNVKAYPGEDTVEVVVKEGLVQFYTRSNPGIDVHAGETGIYSKRTKSFTKLHRADTNVFAYKTGVFAFHSTDLQSVVDRVNEVYDAKIVLGSDKIRDCRLTVNFTNEQLETIVDVIAETLALQVQKDPVKKEIVLTGPGCQ